MEMNIQVYFYYLYSNMLKVLHVYMFQGRPLLVRCSSEQRCSQVITRWRDLFLSSVYFTYNT